MVHFGHANAVRQVSRDHWIYYFRQCLFFVFFEIIKILQIEKYDCGNQSQYFLAKILKEYIFLVVYIF